MTATDDRFDRALRAQHAAALESLSPATRAQLAQRRLAVLRAPAGRAPHRLRYALAAGAAVCALALGLQLRPSGSPAAPAARPALAGMQAAPRADTLLDEDPEFYAWLASSDARLAAME